MKKLSGRGQKWLKSLHIYSGCIWVGCATVLTIMQFFISPESDGELYGILSTLDFIDLFILVPGAIGTFITALIYSIWTNWGWFKHNWITVKWIICLVGLVFGTFWLGPWMSDNAKMAKELGLGALSDPDFIRNQHNSLIFGTGQALTVVFAAFISTLKPWKKKKE